MNTRIGLRLVCIIVVSSLPWTVLAAGGLLHVRIAQGRTFDAKLPAGAGGLTVLSLNLSKDCTGSDAHFRMITLVDTGTGSVQDIEYVTAAIKDSVIAKKYRIDPQSRTVNIMLPSALILKNCSALQLDIVVGTSAVAQWSSHLFSLEFPTDILTDAERVIGHFPLKGKAFILVGPVNRCSRAYLAKLSLLNRRSGVWYCQSLRNEEARRKQ